MHDYPCRSQIQEAVASHPSFCCWRVLGSHYLRDRRCRRCVQCPAPVQSEGMATKARVPGLDFKTLKASGNTWLRGIWSDGETMWVADAHREKVYAYDMGTRARVPGMEFNTLEVSGNDWPVGVWSDGETMWVADLLDEKVYAYHMPSAVAQRSFSPAPVGPGEEVTVTISADNYGSAAGVTEMLPAGFTYISSSLPDSQVTATGQTVKFALFGEMSFTYSVTAPSEDGSYAFSGALRDFDQNDHDVGGDSTVTVAVTDPLVVRYDANNNGKIERNEVVNAINDYLFGEGETTRADVVRLINLYLFG